MTEQNNIANAVLRISMSLVFLYFGFSQVLNPDMWTGYVPEILTGSILTSNNIVMMNGIIELILGIYLITGIYTRVSSLILSVHLLFITLSIGMTPVGVRDFGLAVATLVIFLNGPDIFTLDSLFKKRPKKGKPDSKPDNKEQSSGPDKETDEEKE